jgi:hypothetical protein
MGDFDSHGIFGAGATAVPGLGVGATGSEIACDRLESCTQACSKTTDGGDYEYGNQACDQTVFQRRDRSVIAEQL